MIRTVALVGHAGSGKTTLTEALLYKTGAKERRGRVEEGTTTTDYTPEAKLHRTTVRTGVAPLLFRGHRVFLLDAPGYGDFVGEIRGALEAADAALVAVSAEAGVQVGTERAWTVAERLGLPRMVVVTKLDKGGDYYALLEDLRSTLGPILPIDLPLYEGGSGWGLLTSSTARPTATRTGRKGRRRSPRRKGRGCSASARRSSGHRGDGRGPLGEVPGRGGGHGRSPGEGLPRGGAAGPPLPRGPGFRGEGDRGPAPSGTDPGGPPLPHGALRGWSPLGQGLQGPGGPLYGPGGLPAPLPGKA